jgi:hypothetical protein
MLRSGFSRERNGEFKTSGSDSINIIEVERWISIVNLSVMLIARALNRPFQRVHIKNSAIKGYHCLTVLTSSMDLRRVSVKAQALQLPQQKRRERVSILFASQSLY